LSNLGFFAKPSLYQIRFGFWGNKPITKRLKIVAICPEAYYNVEEVKKKCFTKVCFLYPIHFSNYISNIFLQLHKILSLSILSISI
jgi:hypothetical protein